MNLSEKHSGLCFAAALSTDSDTARAVAEVCSQASEQLGATPDLAFVFTSHHHGPDFEPLVVGLWERLEPGCLLGCTGEAIVGGTREIEGQPALSLWLARLPGVTIRPMHLDFEQTAEGGTFVGLPKDLPEHWPSDSTLFLLGDPFSFPGDQLVSHLNEDQPGVQMIGGMASGAQAPGQNRLFFGSEQLEQGAVAALINGSVKVRSVVSQGCRPIGRHFVITKAQQNVILELGGKPPWEQFQELFQSLGPGDQSLVQQGLHVGRVINEYQEQFGRGDFLVRNVIGVDQKSGAIAIGDLVRPGQTVQFHVRDAQTADEDLNALLSDSGNDKTSPAAGLLFTCNGRGKRLFGQSHHDAATISRHFGDLPLAGLFAQGEIGPIGGQSFLHGFTASIALFGVCEG